jgi:UDP-N-acetylglucosamine diphosphorylase/glucosamine-1-phosphate N-acetyltransferase
MKNIILFDDQHYKEFLPLVYTRPIGNLRCGISCMNEKWELAGDFKLSFFSQPYLSPKFPMNWEKDNYLVNARYFPTNNLLAVLAHLEDGDSLWSGEDLIVARIKDDALAMDQEAKDHFYENLKGHKKEVDKAAFLFLSNIWDIFLKNGEAIRFDYEHLTKGRKSQSIPKTVNYLGDEIFIEEGAQLNFVTLNASTGPIYIGKDAEIMEGSVIRGPFAMLEGSGVKLGAKIYGPTTIGPHSKVGGELNNVVIQAYSNKGHDGFLGNAILGEWCNLGADTNNSNLKNNYATVKTWSYSKGGFKDTGLQFCGLAMGDHSKTGINTMLNTGTVIGVGCNVYGAGFPRTFIPSFVWGGAEGRMVHQLKKFFETAEVVMNRRGIRLSEVDKVMLSHIFEETEKFR